jgi:acyl-CoA synthetase (AMP-forming)/AMP-acid ligase II
METLFELFVRHAQHTPAKIAVSKRHTGGGFTETTYGELTCKAQRFAAFAAHLTPAPLMIPMLVGKSPDSIAFMLGAIAAGRPFCFLNTKYRGPQIAAVLHASQAPICIADAAGLLSLRGAWKEQPRIGKTKWMILGGTALTGIYADAARELDAVADLTLLSDDVREESIPSRTGVQEDVLATCLFTSGSTGTPKGVLISEADLMRRVTTEIAWYGLTDTDVLLSILPFSFDVGLNQLMTALAVGGELVLLESWLPADILSTAAKRSVTGISGVPSIWQDMVNAGIQFDKDSRHASLRYITVSGGSLSTAYLRKLPALVGNTQIFKTYGQTEAFRATSLRPEDYHDKLDSVGKPFPGVRVYVVREDGTRCAVGEVGEVVHTGLGIMMGYLGDMNGQTKLRPNPFYGEDNASPLAIFTGDEGYLDDDGYLFLKGRRDTMFKVMGNRVYPQEITNQLMTVPGIREAVVTGLTRDDGQTAVIAFIAVLQGVDLSAGAVRKLLGAKLPAFMVPREIVFVDHVPRTANGKTDERKLVEAFRANEQSHMNL